MTHQEEFTNYITAVNTALLTEDFIGALEEIKAKVLQSASIPFHDEEAFEDYLEQSSKN